MHPLPQQETKSSTKQLSPTDPILGPENLLKTSFAQKRLLVALPVAISLKVSLKPKRCASATLIQQTSKINTVPKRDRLAVPFCEPHAPLSIRTKKSTSRSHFWAVWRYQMRLQNRKINSKGRPVQRTSFDNCV